MDSMPPSAPDAQPPTPYYSDDLVTLYCGDSAEILPTIAPDSVDVLLTDPPYFQVKDDEWDRQWKKRGEFLTWLGGILDAATPTLRPSASVWTFASPLLTSTIERDVIAPRFRVLNSIRWVKEAGWHQKAEIEAQRRYLTAWEGVLLAERKTSDPDEHRKACMRPISEPLTEARVAAGVSRQEIATALAGAGLYRNEQTGAAMCSDWEHGDSLPPIAAYEVLASLIHLPPYDDFAHAYAACLADYFATRRPFNLARSGPVTDVWNFQPVMGYAGKHPCEKPLAMLDHMIGVSSKPGAVILDPFAGSGSTLRAAKDLGRRAIGIEKDEKWCEHAAHRLAQDVLDFGDGAA